MRETGALAGVPIIRGELRADPDRAFAELEPLFRAEGYLLLLQEDDEGRPVLAGAPERVLDALSPARRPRLQIGQWPLAGGLFLVTAATTVWAGSAHRVEGSAAVAFDWRSGIAYAATLLGILVAHEAGHFLAARRHGMAPPPPLFIPAPFGLGTLGAFIGLRQPLPDRRAMFDVGIAGPLAGLVVAIPALALGLRSSAVLGPEVANPHALPLDGSTLLSLVARLALGAQQPGHALVPGPVALAGWVGLLLTGFNLMPVGQLDGGHVARAVLGRPLATAVALLTLLAAVALALFVSTGWWTWALFLLIASGMGQLAPLNDVSRLDDRRQAVASFALLLLVLIVLPLPSLLARWLGVHGSGSL